MNPGEHQHVFKDLLDRLPGLRGLWPTAAAGNPWLLMHWALTLPFSHAMTCYVCNNFNNLCAVMAPDVLIGGVPCTDFSIVGQRAGLWGPTFPVLATFVRELRELAPAIGILENVVRFPMFMLEMYLSDMFIIVQLNAEPADAGYGLIARERSYFILVNKAKCTVVADMAYLFSTIARHNRQADVSRPRHALLATECEWQRELRWLEALRGSQPHGGAWSAMTWRERRAVQYYHNLYAQRYWACSTQAADLFCFLGDNPWSRITWTAHSGKLPTLRMNAGFMYNIASNRYLTPREKLAAMGFPTYQELAAQMGVPCVLEGDDEARAAGAAVGNSMHLGVLYLVLLVALACTKPAGA